MLYPNYVSVWNASAPQLCHCNRWLKAHQVQHMAVHQRTLAQRDPTWSNRPQAFEHLWTTPLWYRSNDSVPVHPTAAAHNSATLICDEGIPGKPSGTLREPFDAMKICCLVTGQKLNTKLPGILFLSAFQLVRETSKAPSKIRSCWSSGPLHVPTLEPRQELLVVNWRIFCMSKTIQKRYAALTFGKRPVLRWILKMLTA